MREVISSRRFAFPRAILISLFVEIIVGVLHVITEAFGHFASPIPSRVDGLQMINQGLIKRPIAHNEPGIPASPNTVFTRDFHNFLGRDLQGKVAKLTPQPIPRLDRHHKGITIRCLNVIIPGGVKSQRRHGHRL